MNTVFKRILVIVGLILLVWSVIPQAIHIPLQKDKKGKVSKEVVIPPLAIDVNVFGVRIQKAFKTQLGLDLQGGTHLVFETDVAKVKQSDLQDALQSSRDIIERRVNLFGVAEPTVQTVRSGKNYRITVDLPGITNTADAVKLIGQTAQLSFREEAIIPPEIATQNAGLRVFNPNPALEGKDVKKATVAYDQQNGTPQVSLEFSDTGKKKFADLTTKNVGKSIGIFLDQQVLSAPTVQQPILQGNAVISGSFTVDQAKALAVAINSGALPVPIKLIEQKQIGPTLGASEIQKSIFAGLVGLTAVMAFMIIYYGRLGIIACMGLILYALLSLSLFRAIPITLTLSGIAGFILSVGMAVDTNILIFERIKEEKRAGSDHDTAVRLGFGRAIDAIKDANITTISVAFILFNPLNWEFLPQFGLVRGFALTLLIGVAMSLFTGIVITKRLIQLLYKE